MLKDLLASLLYKDLWIHLAWNDVTAKYRRTTLGPLWAIIITAVSILCMSVLGAVLFKVNLRDFLPHVACGMVIWGFISAVVMESCAVFITYAGLIQNVKLPLLSFVLRMFLRNSILFLHSFVILLIVIGFFSSFSIKMLLLIPGFLIYAINAISFGVLLGFFATRYRDITYIIQAVLNIIVLLTPIMWKVEMLGEYQILANINPFTHFIALFREPLLGRSIDDFSLLYVIVFTCVSFILAQYLYAKFKNRLVFWL